MGLLVRRGLLRLATLEGPEAGRLRIPLRRAREGRTRTRGVLLPLPMARATGTRDETMAADLLSEVASVVS